MRIFNLRCCVVGTAVAALLLSGCNGTVVAGPSGVPSAVGSMHRVRNAVKSQYIYVTDRSQNLLLVYPANVSNPSPSRSVSVTHPGGIGVDPTSGNVFVASAGATPKVLEYSPGAAGVINTFSQGIFHPVNVAVEGGYLWVADQDNTASHCTSNSQVILYSLSGGQNPPPIPGVCDPDQNMPLHGIAVDSSGGLFITTSGTADVYPPPPSGCPGTSDAYWIPNPLHLPLYEPVNLTANEQAWGATIDSSENFYVSDYCGNSVETYGGVTTGFAHTGKIVGSFSEPLYETISSDNLLAVPNAGNGLTGFVDVFTVGSALPPVTITKSLVGPIGAAAGPAGATARKRR